MLTFNNNHIFTGYLKQLLSDFNLPNYQIYSDEFNRYHTWWLSLPDEIKKDFPEEDPRILETVPGSKNNPASYYINYIKDGKIMQYINKQWIPVGSKHYHYNKKDLNQTKHLIIKNNYYDSYTHEYLGDFLRFQRDYNGIDLMPLYNCFSENLCTNLKFTITLHDPKDSKKIILQTTFDSNNPNYKIYAIPVKLFEKYTIAIDCAGTIELCCGFFDKYLDKQESLAQFSQITYQKFANSNFSMPILYNKLSFKNLNLDKNNTLKAAVLQNFQNLKLFIKVPVRTKSSIVILEGNYVNYNDNLFIDTYDDKSKQRSWNLVQNKTVTNYEERKAVFSRQNGKNIEIQSQIPEINDRHIELVSNLQLLQLNTGISYPFADRLIEYLCLNTISPLDQNSDNIKRAQYVMRDNRHNFKYDGIWEPQMRVIAYDFMNYSHPIIGKLSSEINHDILGYIDKDVEKYYTSWTITEDTQRIMSTPLEVSGETTLNYKTTKLIPKDSILNVDIYDDIYN